MESIYTVENTIGRALERIWKKGQDLDTWESWNEVYLTVCGMWLFGLFSDAGFDLEEYANMLMDVSAHRRTLTRLTNIAEIW